MNVVKDDLNHLLLAKDDLNLLLVKDDLNLRLLVPPDCWADRCVTSRLVYETEH